MDRGTKHSLATFVCGCLLAVSSTAQTDSATQAADEIYLYVDATLARSSEILALSTALAERSRALADLGRVTVVVADPDPRIHFRSADPPAIRQGLSTLGLRTFGDEELVRLRTEYAEAGAAVAAAPERRRETAAAEAELLQGRFDTLLTWLADNGDPGTPRPLLLLEPALGVDPFAFYHTDSLFALPDLSALGEVAGRYGWRLFPVGLLEEEGGLSVGPPDPGIAGIRVGLPGRSVDTGFRPDLQLDVDRDLYSRLARLTGGLPIHNHSDIDRALAFEPVAADAADVPGAAFSDALPEALILARGRQFLAGGDEGSVEVLPTLERLDAGFRLSVSLDPDFTWEDSGNYSLHALQYREDDRAEVRTWEWPAGETSWSAPEPVPADLDQLAVLFVDTNGIEWGMAFATEGTPEVETLNAASTLLSIPDLPATGLSGRQRFTVEAGPEVDRVEVLLDGRRVDVDRRRPFEARLALGDAALEHSLVVIAYDSGGREIARDGRTLNSASRFSVEIASPPRLTSGPVDVVAEVTAPGDRAVRSVDFYWRTERLGQATRPPYRQRVLVPLDRDQDGYLRVVATLDDGRVTEDILLAGRDRFGSQVTVELMELYVVVTGEDERPVHDLGADAFQILEHGRSQDIAHFRVAGDLPLTVGLAIDSSLSLFKKLPDVQKAAKGFVRSLVPNRDRAFLVGFGDGPRLEHPPTWDLDGVAGAIDRLRPSGNTAVWQAVDFSLDQLRAVSGRRALVVFYDGDDEDLAFPFSATLDKARDSQLPVYLVVMNDEAARTQGEGFAVRSRIGRLEKLAAAGGGRVFYVRTDQDLGEVFQQIAEELRSHYLLAYYPEDPTLQPEWRPVRVEVERPGLTARTVEGYVR